MTRTIYTRFRRSLCPLRTSLRRISLSVSKIVARASRAMADDFSSVSAGFDAAEGDSLGCCNVTPPAYGHMTHMLCALAGGKVVVALEVRQSALE